MRLPKDLLSNTYRKPNIYLCEVDKTKICLLDTSNTKASLKFNSYSELSFEVGRVYTDIISGETMVNPYFDKIEALRLIYVEGFGYFELQGPELVGDGIKESKSCTAYSLEYTLSQKYLEDFYINTGEIDSVEVIYSEDHNTTLIPVTLYNPDNTELSLLHLILDKMRGWTIGHVDNSLKTLSRSFEIDRESIYDFIMNEICDKFNCYVVFDTINNTINVYAESLTSKFIGDGITSTFVLSPPFPEIGAVSVDGYKTTRWTYNSKTGELVLEDIPDAGAHVEIVDGALQQWETDVFVSFNNLSREVKVDYDADSIKTVLTVTYGEDNNIREANLGLPYLTDLSYYYTVDWMGQDLYDAYTAYLQKCNTHQSQYTNNSQDMLNLANAIDGEKNRLASKYAKDLTVDSTTVGTYYVQGLAWTKDQYYYTEVTLPEDYIAGTTYYAAEGLNLTDEKVTNLYNAFKSYYTDGSLDDLEALKSDFEFVGMYLPLLDTLHNVEVYNEMTEMIVEACLEQMWWCIGNNPLQTYLDTYKKIQVANIEAGWSQITSDNYGSYYPVVLFIKTIERALNRSNEQIQTLQDQYDELQQQNKAIAEALEMDKNFTEDQMIRLSAFLREDELHIDDIIETDLDSVSDSFKIKQDAMESGKIELQKICQPQLQFSMTMGNIYALPEFEPIIDQFQLGNVIKVGLRSDYIKQSRLLQVDMGLDDFSDFSCEFGELTSLRTQSDIHADLLAQAISAGKSVATNASYWTKGTEQANSIDLRLQEGLLNSIEALKMVGGSQNSYIDKYGIHLEVINPETGEIGDKRIWMVNNQIVFTDDGFKTSKSVLGEFTVDGETYYGLLAEAVISGLIEGSSIKGGTIRIGEFYDENGQKKYRFEVDEAGNVTMNAASISGYVTDGDMTSAIEQNADSILSEISKTYATTDKITHYGSCGTISADPTKFVRCIDFIAPKLGEPGAIISIYFTNANTAASPELNINSTGAVPIRAYGNELGADSTYNWAAKSVVTFVFDGEFWCISDSGALHQTQTLSSKITQTVEEIRAEVNKTLEDEYSNTIEMNAAITQTAESIKTEVSEKYATVGQAKHYGTCTTDANTASKIVACDGFDRYTGATISVNFKNSNTVANPTLKVGSTNAASIMAYGAPLSRDSVYNWTANSVVTFVFDGNYWNIVDSGALKQTAEASSKFEQTAKNITASVDAVHETLTNDYSTTEEMKAAIDVQANSITSTVSATYATKGQVNHYGTCDTAGDVIEKEVDCEGFELYKGASITVKFTHANSVAEPKLNINGKIRYIVTDNDESLSENSKYNWDDNSTVTFVYDGSYWKLSNSATLKRTKALSSEIKQEADKISLIVKKNSSGTNFEVNSDAVRIAWNKNSNYIQFENGTMNIYTSSTSHTSSTLLMKHDHQGAWYYNSGTTIGRIGTNSFVNYPSCKGLVFDLEYNAGYMCWAAEDTADASAYTVKLVYYHDNTVDKKGLHLSCDTYADGNLYLTDTHRIKQYTSYYVGYEGGIYFVDSSHETNQVAFIMSPEARQFDVRGESKCSFLSGSTGYFGNGSVCQFGNYSKLEITNYVTVDYYSDIDMHNFSILNQSDARLKTNIQDTQVDALSLINAIEMKEFDWVENGEHEDIGIIAQQLQNILPTLVHEDSQTGKLSIRSNKFIPYLIKAIQELSNHIMGDTSVFSMTRRRWADAYTDDEKIEFTSKHSCYNKSYNNIDDIHDEIIELKELEKPEILIPIKKQGDENNE